MQIKPLQALILLLADSALLFRVRCGVEHCVETRRAIDTMNTALYRGLEQAGMELAVLQEQIFVHGPAVTPMQQQLP